MSYNEPHRAAQEEFASPGAHIELKVGGCVLGDLRPRELPGIVRASPAQRRSNRFILADLVRLATGLRAAGILALDDGELVADLLFDAALPRLVARAAWRSEPANTMLWCRQHLPELLADPKNTAAWFAKREIAALKLKRPFMDVDQIARHLGIKAEWVELFGLTTLPAVTNPKRLRTARKRKGKRIRNAGTKARARLESGAIPQAESISATAPWNALSMSRSEYYRQGLNRHHPASKAARQRERETAQVAARRKLEVTS